MCCDMGQRNRRILTLAALCATYLEGRRRLLARVERDGTRLGPRWLGLLAAWFLNKYSELNGVRLASEGGEGLQMLDPARRYMIVWHPHGFLAWSAMFIVPKMAIMGHPHGREWFAMVAPALFRLPIFSEALMLVNGRQVDKSVVENLAEKGKSIALQPGGVKEQMISRHDQEQAVFPANLGFIRQAIKYGMDLLPVYIFNENQMFKRVDGFEKTTRFIYDKTGFGLPTVTARFGLPMAGLLPLSTDIHVRWGAPLEVGPADANPSQERVEELFCRYVVALQQLFQRHAAECLPADVAAKGLKIIRLDGKPVPQEAPSREGLGQQQPPKPAPLAEGLPPAGAPAIIPQAVRARL